MHRLALLPCLPLLAGCVVAIGNKGTAEAVHRDSATKTTLAFTGRPALLHHLVLIRLNDPRDLAALTADCDRLLPSIPGVVEYWRGTHLDVGRPNVIGDYSLALHVAFASREAYLAYLESPQHLELANLWRPRSSSFIIYDAWDPGSGS